ncbi:MAG: Planctomycete cytochrome [Verrucomicrobiales bacterium]|nr:Planctomycete cytochrome [Verrucomicrobiales bacterium]
MPFLKKTILALTCSFSSLAAAGLARAEAPSFSKDIRPLLSDTCLKCHGPDDKGRKGDLRLDLPESAHQGGKSGVAAIVPGKVSESEVIKRLRSTDPDEVMPPPAMKRVMKPEEIKLFEDWVAAGAKYEKHWAFDAPVLPPVPAPVNAAWPARNEIDAFVQPALAAEGFAPAPEAERATLFRRASFDLTGLPPTPAEWAAFQADTSPEAWEHAVDRLLASPKYGEKWGRRWLDLARYADTNGYEKDRPRSIWPYRDWVIRSLNADMPFDQFTIEQIAGDLLPNPTRDQLIATGFHRNTMQNEEGGIDPLEFRYYAMVDRVATTSATWLGLTLQCAQCHTHKYDPVTHREYFSIMAFLNNADEPELELPAPDQAEQERVRGESLKALLEGLPARWLEKQNRPDNIVWVDPASCKVQSTPEEPAVVQPDKFVLFNAPGPERATLTFQMEGVPAGSTHLRLEALTDAALPGKGPGRTPHGNFVLSEIQAQQDGRALKLVPVSASAEQNGYPLSAAVDGQLGTGWAVDDGKGKVHSPQFATFAFDPPLQAGTPVTVTLQQQFGGHHTIGRPKLSFGTAAKAPAGPAALDRAFDAWAAAQQGRLAHWTAAIPAKATSNLPLLAVQPDATVFVSGDITKADTYQLEFHGLTNALTAVRLEVLPDSRLPGRGPGMAYYEGPKGDFFLGEFQMSSGGQPVKIASASESYAKNTFGQPVSAALATDGNPETGWSCAEGQGRAHEAVFVFEKPLLPVDGKVSLTMMFGRHYACSLGKFRVSFTGTPGAIQASALPPEVQPLLTAAPSAADRPALMREFLLQAPELAEARKEIEALRQPVTGTTTLVLHERPAGSTRPTFIHNRGEFTQPTDEVQPGVLSVLNPLPPGAPANRLSFARWLVSRDQPLTARVVVNRSWGAFFGRGLVKTQEDFGFQSQLPSHPALLDWLAVRFMDDGWSMKKLHRRIVLSHTYRQSSRDDERAAGADPENKWLWRGPRLRLDAEEVRDAALQAAGLLSDKMYGPGVYPPQPASVTTEGTYGALAWPVSTGADRYRRSVYTFAKRTAPFAFATTFDAPTGEACIVRRDRSNTPLQALSMLNDVTIMEAATAFGTRLAARPGTPSELLNEAFLTCFSRLPEARESEALLIFFSKQLAGFQAHPENASALAGKEATPAAAAWTLVCRALLNLDEFVTKN